MNNFKIKIKKRRWFIVSAVTIILAVSCLIGIGIVWENYRMIGNILLAVCVLSAIAAILTFSLGMVAGDSSKKKHSHESSADEKVDEEEFEEICQYDLLDDD